MITLDGIDGTHPYEQSSRYLPKKYSLLSRRVLISGELGYAFKTRFLNSSE
jgi:hypothetical protein